MPTPRPSFSEALRSRALLALLAASPLAQQSQPAPPRAAAVTRAELEADLRFLASDELAGRFTGSPGAARAADYLAEQLARSGCEPAGDAGGYLQPIGLARFAFEAVPTLAFQPSAGEPVHALLGRDFETEACAAGRGSFEIAELEAALAASPERRRELALLLPRARAAREDALTRLGAARGAGFGAVLLASSPKAGKELADLPADVLKERDEAWAVPALRLRGELLERVQAHAFARVELELRTRADSAGAANVLARLPATRARAAGEAAPRALVLSAHYDHLKPRANAPESGPDDRIYNGADDDASGCAALLEIAGALAAEPERELELVLLFATAEEIGLVGTNYYLEHPVAPLARTSCNLNLEMIGRPDELVGGAGKLWLTGAERSNLGAAWERAGLAIRADPHPEQHFFERSDNYAFARRGIVAQTLSSYNLHKDYHTPADEADRIDWAHLLAGTEVALAAARTLVRGELEPAWLDGGDPSKR